MNDDQDQIIEPVVPVETDYQVGQDNVEVWGFDIHNPVFVLSACLVLFFVGIVLGFPEQSNHFLIDIRDTVLNSFDQFFSLSISFFSAFILLLMISPFGRIRLGGVEAEPDFGFLSWICMLFAAGVGIGMIFYGAGEPLAYYTGPYGTPLNIEPLTEEAYRMAFSATIFHWGWGAWSVYALVGLAIAFFAYNWNLPLTIRSIFYPILGERVWGWPGNLIDLTAVVATLFGLATSLGIGAKQVSAGLYYLFDLTPTIQVQSLIIAMITSIAIFSVIRGLERGVRVLSNINIALAFMLLVFVICFGPTADIFAAYLTNAQNYLSDMFTLSEWRDRQDRAWFHSWTIFYWAWWISWSPFVGMFIARISRGRTVRQFLFVVMFVPLFIALVWFTSFGETAIQQYQLGIGTLPDGITDFSLVLFQMLEQMAFPMISSLFAVVLLVIFFVTSSDSGSLVVDSITAGGKLHAPTVQRVFWAIVEGLLAIVLLVGGGGSALGALQAGAISSALPFTFILLIAAISLLRGLYLETYHLKKLEQD